MSIVIKTTNTATASMIARHSLANSRHVQVGAFRKSPSEVRVDMAGEDFTDLAISDRMQAMVRGMNQAVRSSNDAIATIQVADSSLVETAGALQRMRNLAVQAVDGTRNDRDRWALQHEVNQLVSEIDRIAGATQFNSQFLVQGSYSGSRIFQVGTNADQVITVSIPRMTASVLGVDTATVGVDGADMAGFGGGEGVRDMAVVAEQAIVAIDNAMNSVTTMRAKLGVYQGRFESVIANVANLSLDTSVAKSRVVDADIAAEIAILAKDSMVPQAGVAVLIQANQQPGIVLQLLK